MSEQSAIGFIGLGVMGEPICRNLVRKAGRTVLALDTDPAPLTRLAADGVQTAAGVSSLMAACDTVFLSLPSGEVVKNVCEGPEGLLAYARTGQCVVDLGTSPVDITRALAKAFEERGADFADAPVARTRTAAESGSLAVMVGASTTLFARLQPLIRSFASDIAHCGPAGCGQIVKILNNMVLFETVAALGEAKAIGERAGIDPAVLFDTLSTGSADSFALRSHGMKAILPAEFPERAFSVRYARKDLRYALDLAEATGVDARGAQRVEQLFDEAIQAGLGDAYHPVISLLIAARKASA